MTPQTVVPSDQRRLITGTGTGTVQPNQRVALLIGKDAQSATATATDQHILPTIAIEIIGTDHRTRPAQRYRHSRLSSPFIKRSLRMGVIEPALPFGELGRSDRGDRDRNRRFGRDRGFLDLVAPLRLQPAQATDRTTAPAHLERLGRPGPPQGGENPLRRLSGEVSPAGDDLLRLGHPTARPRHAGPDAVAIEATPLQPDGHARRHGVVAIQLGRSVECIDHDLQIAIAVQVGQGHAVRHLGRREPPGLAHRFKPTRTEIPE